MDEHRERLIALEWLVGVISQSAVARDESLGQLICKHIEQALVDAGNNTVDAAYARVMRRVEALVFPEQSPDVSPPLRLAWPPEPASDA